MGTEQVGPAFDTPPPRRRGGKVLYLDFDGAVHPSEVWLVKGYGPQLIGCPGHKLFEHCPVLERELAPYPNVAIVLSTSWVVNYRGSIHRLAKRLTPGLAARVIGATFHSRMDRQQFAELPRGLQIFADVIRRRPSSWVAIDDDDQDWPNWCRDRLVLTDSHDGLGSTGAINTLRELLREMSAKE